MDSERERLLLARAEELEREYGDLVRALDAACEAVRSINTALSENRAESRRVFQERLAISATPSSSASPKENGLIKCSVAGVSNLRVLRTIVAKKISASDVVPKPKPGVVRVADQAVLFKTSNETTSTVNRANTSTTRCTSDVIASNFIYHLQPHQNHHNNHTTASSSAVRTYVGNEHSYAVNDSASDDMKDETKSVSTPAGSLKDEGTSLPTWHSVFNGDEEKVVEEKPQADVDLTIVKDELPDETLETVINPTLDPLATNTKLRIIAPKSTTITTTSNPDFRALIAMRNRRGRKPVSRTVQERDEELKRKRRQTRERMRRWRAKKRMERLTCQAGKSRTAARMTL